MQPTKLGHGAFSIAALVILSALLPGVASASQPFIVFDGLLYVGKPDLSSRGLVPIAGTGDIWRPSVSHDTVDAVQIVNIFQRYRNRSGYFYIDIENWPLVDATPQIRQQNIDKLGRVISIAKQTAPRMHIGFYGLLPGITYWPLVYHEAHSPTWNDPAMQAGYEAWFAVEQQLVPLAVNVDAVFPSLYTFYDDPKGWAIYARQTLIEARRFGKPVYAFLWPEYHEGGTAALRGQLIPPDVWRAELELCAQNADGVVLWGGYQQQWNEQAPWWAQTLAFMTAHRIAAVATH